MVAAAIAPRLSAEEWSWSHIQPARSTESQIYTWFGAPTEVVATFPWRAWAASPDTRLTTKSYTFRYRKGESKSPLLQGPGGLADSASVAIYNGIVNVVEWTYGGPSARAAAQVLQADPEMTFSSPTSPCYGSKPSPHGRVFAELGENDSEVRVVYDLK